MRTEVLKLYRQLLRESMKFSSYNYRLYAIRKVKDSFRENKDVEDVEKLVNYGTNCLNLIKRQVLIDNLYKTTPLVVEAVQHPNGKQ